MSHSQDSLKGGYIGDHIGDYCRAYEEGYQQFRLQLVWCQDSGISVLGLGFCGGAVGGEVKSGVLGLKGLGPKPWTLNPKC